MNRVHPENFYAENAVIRGGIFVAPNKVDTTDGTVIYSGFARINENNLEASPIYLVKKTVINGALIENYFAYGTWSARLTLEYVGDEE